MPNPFGKCYHKENPDIMQHDLSCRTLSFASFVALCDSVLNLRKKSQPQVCYKYQKQQFPHHKLFAAFGINYNDPLTPMEIFQREATRKAQRSQYAAAEAPASHPVHSWNHAIDPDPSDTATLSLRAESQISHTSDSSKEYHCPTHDEDPLSSNDQRNEDVRVGCCVCFDELQEIFLSNRHLMATFCGHIFCNSCLKVVVKTNPFCPVCRKKIVKKSVHRIYL